MTYRQFVEFFLAPCVAVALIGLLLRARWQRPNTGFPLARGCVRLAVVTAFAVVYTTPWDSWLIHNRVWWYPPGSVLGTVFGVPFEEYAFMLGLTVFTGCWTLAVAIGRPRPAVAARGLTTRRHGAAAWLAAACCGAVLTAISPKLLYLGSMLLWFGIPLALQAAFGADVLRSVRTLRIMGLALTPVFWIADAVAINAGAWQVGATHTIGIRIAGLPIEEAIFFLLCDLLVANSIVLVTHPAVDIEFRRLRTKLRPRPPGHGDNSRTGDLTCAPYRVRQTEW